MQDLKNNPQISVKLDACVKDLENIFNSLFKESENTVLLSGADEPLYSPAGHKKAEHTIYSTKDYFSSALHEISHWCIAGKERRLLMDYGYWYEPDGRTVGQQQLFEQVEVKPQALEWIFTFATGQPFRLSVDNVNQPELVASEQFKEAVWMQAQHYVSFGLPDRAHQFCQALLDFYADKKRGFGKTTLRSSDFKRQDLR